MRTIILVLLVLFTSTSFATQVVEWNKRPIDVVLQVGKERIIQVPDNVLVGVPNSIKPLLRVQPAQGYVYLTALESFSESRLQLKMHKTGEIILVDVSTTTQNTTDESIVIKLPKQVSNNNSVVSNQPQNQKAATPIELTRFATRTFYAPERLAVSDRRIRMSKAPKVNLDGLFTGSSFNVFDAKAMAVFRTGKLYLTAIKLVNKTPMAQPIVFTDINADFMYATPQHVQINRMNVPGDTTMLYLITDKPLAAALYLPSVSQHGIGG
jgi:integrating conjugative element protein (TIGR03749 family)